MKVTVELLSHDHAFALLTALVAREVRLARKPGTTSIVKAQAVNAENIAAVETALGMRGDTK